MPNTTKDALGRFAVSGLIQLSKSGLMSLESTGEP